MDRKYIENEHIVDRYLSGDLTVREARQFEKYCLEHPQFLEGMPIPVRLKARLARRPLEASETGMFHAIPSSTTRAALEAGDEGFDVDEEEQRWRGSRGGGNRILLIVLTVALIAAIGGMVMYALQVRELSKNVKTVKTEMKATQMTAATSLQPYRLQLSRNKPQQPTLALGWMQPPQMLDMYFDATDGKYNQFQVTIDKVEGGRVMQIRRIARDSNKDVRLALNSSAFGPGDYLLKFEGVNWRGQLDEVGWVWIGLE
ncbi:MAG TPA: hypothetical protein VGN07_14665 [Steroidobacteraceae bacterium]|jgi:hypothetical protein